MAEKPAPVLVLLSEFARLVGAEPGELEGLARARRFPKAAGGRIPLIEATRFYITALRERARDASLLAAQERARTARAASAELSVAIEGREMIPDDEANAAVQHVTGVVNSVAYGLPARATRDLHARRAMERAVGEALGRSCRRPRRHRRRRPAPAAPGAREGRRMTPVRLRQPIPLNGRLVCRVGVRALRPAQLHPLMRGWTPEEAGPAAAARADRITAAQAGLTLAALRSLTLADFLAVSKAAEALRGE